MAWTNVVTRATGYVVTATNWNEVVNNFKAIGDAWTSYTPTWTGAGGGVIGNGTRTGAYMQAGKLTVCRGRVTWGSTTTLSGTFEITLPFAAVVTSDYPLGGHVFIRDTSASAVFIRAAYTADGSVLRGISEAGTLVGSTSPMTFATGDTITWQINYEAA